MLDLSNLKTITDGNAAMLQSFLAEFTRTTELDLNELKQAIEHRDNKSIARLSHRIKGAAAIVGASELAELSSQLERSGKQNQMPQSAQLFDELSRSYKKVSEEIEHYQ